MKLSIAERYVLLDLMPKEGSYTTLKMVKGLRESLAFSEEEVDKFDLKETMLPTGGSNITWDVKKEEEVEISMSEKTKKMVFEALTRLDVEGKLTAREFSLYEKFVETGEV